MINGYGLDKPLYKLGVVLIVFTNVYLSSVLNYPYTFISTPDESFYLAAVSINNNPPE
jgi:hypothetical protein